MADIHGTFIKAYADGIVESLKARFMDSYASVSLGEENIEADLIAVNVKFFWESSSSIGLVTRSYGTVLKINSGSGLVSVGETDMWGSLTFQTVDVAADWIAQQEQTVPDFSW